MDRRSSLLALCPLAAVCIAFSANGFTVWQNRSVFFAATELVSNGVPGLTNMGSRLTVSAVPPVSAQGGRVTVINTQVWARFYQGPGHYDQAIGIVTDRSNNVCITGYSLGAGTSFDFATIMYAPDGTPLWTNRYDGPAGDCDFARYLAVDGLGNIYVTGESVGAEGATDVATIKYSANGLPAWTNRYNFSGTNIHYIAGIAADGVGNVYVGVGAISSQQMFITLKYDPLGRAVWTNYYRGSECGVDYPAALAVDRFGNVFVTGGSDTSTGQGFATLKYAADGRGLWTNLFTRSPGILPRDLAVDQTGNVIVAGENGIGGGITHVYATVKYANNGQTASGTATIIVLAQLAFSTSAADLGLTAAGFQVRVQSPNGINPVVIYGSTNLSDWQPLFTNPPVNGSLPFLDRVGTNFPRRFYRAVQEQ